MPGWALSDVPNGRRNVKRRSRAARARGDLGRQTRPPCSPDSNLRDAQICQRLPPGPHGRPRRPRHRGRNRHRTDDRPRTRVPGRDRRRRRAAPGAAPEDAERDPGPRGQVRRGAAQPEGGRELPGRREDGHRAAREDHGARQQRGGTIYGAGGKDQRQGLQNRRRIEPCRDVPDDQGCVPSLHEGSRGFDRQHPRKLRGGLCLVFPHCCRPLRRGQPLLLPRPRMGSLRHSHQQRRPRRHPRRRHRLGALPEGGDREHVRDGDDDPGGQVRHRIRDRGGRDVPPFARGGVHQRRRAQGRRRLRVPTAGQQGLRGPRGARAQDPGVHGLGRVGRGRGRHGVRAGVRGEVQAVHADRQRGQGDEQAVGGVLNSRSRVFVAPVSAVLQLPHLSSATIAHFRPMFALALQTCPGLLALVGHRTNAWPWTPQHGHRASSTPPISCGGSLICAENQSLFAPSRDTDSHDTRTSVLLGGAASWEKSSKRAEKCWLGRMAWERRASISLHACQKHRKITHVDRAPSPTSAKLRRDPRPQACVRNYPSAALGLLGERVERLGAPPLDVQPDAHGELALPQRAIVDPQGGEGGGSRGRVGEEGEERNVGVGGAAGLQGKGPVHAVREDVGMRGRVVEIGLRAVGAITEEKIMSQTTQISLKWNVNSHPATAHDQGERKDVVALPVRHGAVFEEVSEGSPRAPRRPRQSHERRRVEELGQASENVAGEIGQRRGLGEIFRSLILPGRVPPELPRDHARLEIVGKLAVRSPAAASNLVVPAPFRFLTESNALLLSRRPFRERRLGHLSSSVLPILLIAY